MPTQNVNLPDEQAKFIRQRVKSGRYQNASEVVRAGLRLLQRQEAEDKVRLETLQRVAQESFAALDRGEARTFSDRDLNDLFDRVDRATRPA